MMYALGRKRSRIINNTGMQCHPGKVGGHVFFFFFWSPNFITERERCVTDSEHSVRDSKKHGRRPSRDDTSSHRL